MGSAIFRPDDPAFWGDEAPAVFWNPRLPEPCSLLAWVSSPEQASDLGRHCLFSTSGSEGRPKWVAISRQALLLSAWQVNDHLKATRDDIWLRALPLFHVGGFAIHARALVGKSRAIVFDQKWSASAFCQAVEQHHATLTSLVPTQVYDLVQAQLPSPPSLRAIVVGGGELRPALANQARNLGWPVLASYGLSEAGSQVATEPLSLAEMAKSGRKEAIPSTQLLSLLGHWQAQVDSDQRLALSGPGLFSGYVTPSLSSDDDWRFHPIAMDHEGWWTTNDRVALTAPRELRFLGRSDAVIKIRGELLDLHPLTGALEDLATASNLRGALRLVAQPDERCGHRLCLLHLDTIHATGLIPLLKQFKTLLPPFAPLEEIKAVSSLPTSPLGKPLFTPQS